MPAANFGVAGDTTQNVLWRLAQGELTGENPSLVVVLIGTNNLGRGDSPEEAALGATAVVRAVRGRFPAAKVLLLGIFPRGAKRTILDRERVRRANASLSRLDDGAEVRYLDVGPNLLEKDSALSPSVMPDFLHPSVEVYRRWADAMDPLLRGLLSSNYFALTAFFSLPRRAGFVDRGDDRNLDVEEIVQYAAALLEYLVAIPFGGGKSRIPRG